MDEYQFDSCVRRKDSVEIWKIHRIRDDRIFGAKIMPLNDQSLQEFQILFQLGHPNIIQYVDYYVFHKEEDETGSRGDEDPDMICIITEWADGGDLLDWFRIQKEPCSEMVIWNIFVQILAGVREAHRLNIYHCDLKVDNIVLHPSPIYCGNDPTKDRHIINCRITIIDWGLSIQAEPDTKLDINCGTISYIAPELWHKHPNYNGPPIDIWCLGNILYNITYGRNAFNGKDLLEIKRNICSNDYVHHREVSPELQNLIDRMLTKDPHLRITLPQIDAHPWIQTHPEYPKFSIAVKVFVPEISSPLP